MIRGLRAELRKLFTVTWTYILLLGGLVLTIVIGIIMGAQRNAAGLASSTAISDVIILTVSSLPIILASIVAILLMAQEYRYGMIMHTLTLSNSRVKVLLAKILATSVLAVVYTALVAALAVGAFLLGIKFHHGAHLGPQSIDWFSVGWRCLYYGWASLMAALAITVIVRNQVGAIVLIFAIPTAEALTSLIPSVREHAVYLPFSGALDSVLQHANSTATLPTDTLSYARAALTFTFYLLIAWIVAAFLFLDRDAN